MSVFEVGGLTAPSANYPKQYFFWKHMGNRLKTWKLLPIKFAPFRDIPCPYKAFSDLSSGAIETSDIQ